MYNPFFHLQLEMLNKTGLVDQAVEISAMGTERYPAFSTLWKKRLELSISRQDPVKEVQKLLKQAELKVPQKVVLVRVTNFAEVIAIKECAWSDKKPLLG